MPRTFSKPFLHPRRCSSALILLLVTILTLIITSRSKTIKESWKQFEGNPVICDKQLGTTFDPFVMKTGDEFWMYLSLRKTGSIGLSRSVDGYHWSKPLEVLSPTEQTGWEKRINRCCVVRWKNRFYMYYTGQQGNSSAIGLAISEDGIHFTRYSNQSILWASLPCEGTSVMNPFVMYDETDALYKMWYSAGAKFEPDVICYAVSTDGITWNKYSRNPIFSKGHNEYDQVKVSVGHVLKEDNHYIMFYIGYRTINRASICIAVSKNGVSGWKRYSGNPIITPGQRYWDKDACYKPTVYHDRTTQMWMLWYNGRRKNQENIGLSTFRGDISGFH